MCGIIGYVGNTLPPIDVVLNGLSALEYRGYDSAGISAFNGGPKPLTIKAEGKVANLKKKVDDAELSASKGVSIGHTRWATHGFPTEANAHPHTDCTGKISLVHNGIIDNYAELKAELQRNGHRFASMTDTEVLPHLIEREFGRGVLTLEEAVRNALRYVKGVFAIAVVSAHVPEKLVIARRVSPLILGVCDGDYVVASDHPPILPHTNRVIYLGEDEMAVVTPQGYDVLDIATGERREKELVTLTMSVEEAQKGSYPHFMLKEIHDAPYVIENAIRGRIDIERGEAVLPELDGLAPQIASARRLVIAACGTSYYASLVGKLLIERSSGVPVEAVYASELRYSPSSLSQEDLVIVVSQSGETADTQAALMEARSRGCKVVGIVNAVGSNIARSSDATLYVHAGPEIAVASTKAFVSQLVAFVLLSLHVAKLRGKGPGGAVQTLEALRALPERARRVLAESGRIRPIAEKYSRFENSLFLGRGLGWPVALEGSLKLKEVSYIHAEGYPAGEMKHGANALITEDLLAVFVALKDDGPLYEKVLSNISEVASRGGRIVAVAYEGDREIAERVDDVLYVPRTAEACGPVLAVLPLQLFAYHIACMRGSDVDQPRNLAKSVTVE